MQHHMIPRVIGLTGGSASGKTSFARRLQYLLGDDRSLIVSQDSYYIDQDLNDPDLNFDHPSAIDFDLLYEHLCAFDRGEAAHVPNYDFSTHRRFSHTRRMQPKEIILVDGTLILSHTELRARLDHCVFFDFPEKIRLERRLKRDIQERGRTEDFVRNQFRTQVQPMHEIYIEPLKTFANIIINSEESFEENIWKMLAFLRPLSFQTKQAQLARF